MLRRAQINAVVACKNAVSEVGIKEEEKDHQWKQGKPNIRLPIMFIDKTSV